MEKFVVSARKYRPSEFEEVVGQSGVTQTLEKAVKSKHLGHSFLFCGPRGVGKTTCARILSRMINRESEDDKRDYSINIFELDAASNNSVDDIKLLIDQVRIPPQIGEYKVYIIDEVHMLSTAAFNAFLKTLEEPPSYAIFILATTEKHKILPTILSRCQIYDFKRIGVKDIVEHLEKICKAEGIEYEETALSMVAQKADGALRDALSMFDRLVDRSSQSISFESVIRNLNILDYDYYFRITDLLMAQDLPQSLLLLDEVMKKGFDGEEFIAGLSEHLRNLMVSKEAKTRDLLEAGGDLNLKYQQQALLIPIGFLLNALDLANDCQIKYKTARNKRLQVELALMKIAHLTGILNWEEKKKHIKAESSAVGKLGDFAPAAKKMPEQPQANLPKAEEKKPEPVAEEKTKESPKETVEKTAKPKGINIGVNLSKLRKREFKKEEKTEKELEVIAPNKEVKAEELTVAWDKLREEYKANDSVFFPILEHSEARLNAGEVELVFDSIGSRELFSSRSEEIVRLFYRHLGFKIPVKATVEKAVEDKAPKKVFTTKDKWKLLEEKHPDLKLLKDKFQLILKD